MSTFAESPRTNAFPDDSEDSMAAGYKPHSFSGTMDDPSVRQQLYDSPRTKMCYFYKDGDLHQKAMRVVINPRRYHDLEILKNELTQKVPELPFGVRSIYTPHGRTHINSLDDLQDSGNYVCSTHRNKARGVDIARVSKRTPWHRGRPSSRILLNRYLNRHRDDEPKPTPRRKAWPAKNRDNDQLYGTRVPKKITVLKNGEPHIRHTILLNRKTSQSFEQVIDDMCQIFQMPIRKVYTLEGRPVHSLSSIFNGPDTYVVTGGDRYKPMTAMSEPTPLPKRRRFEGDADGRRLKEKKERNARSKGKWKVYMTTNELPSAGTHAQVSITVYGQKGNSGPLPLTYGEEDAQAFQAGSVDEFDISVGNIGEIYKIRIGHDNTGDFPGWFLDEVRMEDIHTGEELKFLCQRWMSRDEDDREICRELPVVRNGHPVRPVVVYDVQVVTGDLWNAGTNANVYITVYGQYGDTGVRQLYKPSMKKFNMGQTDHFRLEAVHLGELQRVIVGHDGAGPGSGWFLDKIVIRETPNSSNEVVFPCSRWLDEGEDDGKIVRELKPLDEYTKDILEKQMFEYEKWKFQSGNQVILYPKTTQRPLRIKADASVDSGGNHHDDNAVFIVAATKHDRTKVLQNKRFNRYHLAIDNNKMLGQGRGGSYCEFRIKVQEDRSVCLESSKYMGQYLTITPNGKPGNPRGSPNDPSKQFFVYCKGVMRDGGIVLFNTSVMQGQTVNIDHNNTLYATGKRNKLAHFRVHKVDENGIRMFESMVYPKQFIRIKDGQVDINGKGDEFCHFRMDRVKEQGYITLESLSNRGIFIGMSPDGKIRPTVNTGDKNVRLYPEVIEFGRSRLDVTTDTEAEEPTPVPVQRRSPSPRTPTPPPRQRSPSPTPTPTDSLYDEGEWKMWVTSAESVENADVSVVVYGDKGNSGRIVLGKAKDKELFRSGNIDEFKINLESVGTIYKIRMELNPVSKKKDPSWKIKEVKLQDMATRETLKFKFNRWLSRSHDDGDIMRELPAVRPKKRTLPVLHYQVHVYTGSQPNADTEANVYIMLFGERGDTGRRLLMRSDNDVTFQEGQCDRFELEAVSLGRLTRCVLSHDGEGPGEGWFCEQVIVRESDNASEEYIFPCNKWLDAGIDDKKTERVLRLADDFDEDDDSWIPEDDGDYDSEFSTSVSNSPTYSGPAHMENTTRSVHDACTSPIVDLAEKAVSAKPQVASAAVNTDAVPSPTPVLTHDMATSPFPEEHHAIPVTKRRTDPKPSEPTKEKPKDGDWTIWVTTGRDSNMGTTNEVSLVAYGSKGKSESVILADNPNKQHFQPSQTDEFKVHLGPSRNLGELYKIRIGHSDQDTNSGWFVEKIKMRNMVTDEVLSFRVNRWMSRGEEDCGVCRELPVVRPGKKPLPIFSYKVDVYTGKEPGADTEASVYVQLIGARGDSGKRLLYKSLNNDMKFQEGQMDTFEVEAVSLKEIKQVVIGHDGHGKGAGWFCEKVVVRESDESDARLFYFPCERWLDEGLDDQKIERILDVADPPKQSKGEYLLWVKTCKDSKPPKGSKAVLTVYAERGKSTDIELGLDKGSFEPGNTDEFQIAIGDLGPPYKIRIGRREKDRWAGWHLQEVKMLDKDTREEMVFPFNRWMDRTKDDHDIVRELPVIQEGRDSLPVVKYEVTVFVGDRWAASTDADVHVTLFGSKGDSGKRRLYHSVSNHERMFQRKQADTFVVEAVSLQELRKLVIGHNGQGHGSGVFIEKVTVKETDGDMEVVFPCNQWLDDHEADGLTERELRPSSVQKSGSPSYLPPKKGSKTQGEWSLVVKTGDIVNAGTHAQVYVTAYGSKGASNSLPLSSKTPDDFDRDKESEFKIHVGDIGDLLKIRIEHDNSGDFPSWFLQKITMTDNHTKEMFSVDVNRWLSLDDDNGQLCRELPLTRDGQSPLPVLNYAVMVYTSGAKESATEANVEILLKGEMGDSGWHPLSSSKVHNVKWLSGQMDLFTLEAVHLGRLSSLMLQHDGQTEDSAWMVEKVVVKETQHALHEFLFPCNEWIEPRSGGKDNKKEFFCGGEQPISPVPEMEAVLLRSGPESRGHWKVWTYTGPESDPPCDCKVFITVCGMDGASPPVELTLEETADELDARSPNKIVKSRKSSMKPPTPKFLPGTVDEFSVKTGPVGEVFKIRLTMDKSGENPAWFVQRLKMKDEHTKQEFHFLCNFWLKADTPEEDIVVELPAIRPDSPPLKEMCYELSVKTGSMPGAETDADVYCVVVGNLGDSGQRHLVRSLDDGLKFQQNKVDSFELRALDVGQVKHIKLGHTRFGRGRGWFCEKATMRIGKEAASELIFPCNRWFDSSMEDRQIERILLPAASVKVRPDSGDKQPSSRGEYKAYAKTGKAPGTQNGSNSNNNNNNSDDDADDDDFRDDDFLILNSNNSNNKQSKSGGEPRREISVYAYGANGMAGPIPLDNGDEDMFAPGKDDEFDLHVGDIGEIYKIRVCDGSGNFDRKPWILRELMLQDVHTKQTLTFDFSEFVGETVGDHCKELPAIHPDQTILPVVKYHVTVLMGLDDDSDPEAEKASAATNAKGKNLKKKGREESKVKPEEHDLWICLHGTRGDSGFRQMSDGDQRAKYIKGRVKEYVIEAVDLDKVHKVSMRKDSDSPFALKEVTVRSGEYSRMEGVFTYNKIIPDDEHAALEITLSEKREASIDAADDDSEWPTTKGRWEVTAYTGKDQEPELDATQPAVILVGRKGQSSPTALKPVDSSHPSFQSGATEKFRIRVKAEEIGEISLVKVGFLKGRQNTKWFLHKIQFDDMDSGDQFSIEYNDWVEHESGWTELKVQWPGLEDLSATNIFFLDVHTSDLPNASTNEPVFVHLYGKNEKRKVKTDKIWLSKSCCVSPHATLFHRGQVDQFVIETKEIEDLEKVYIGHGSTVKGAGWHLDKVILTNGRNRELKKEFQCQRWFDAGEDDHQTERYLLPAASALTPVPDPVPAPRATPTPEIPEIPQKGLWDVKVHTSQVKNPDVTAKLIVVIYGDKGRSAEIPLNESPIKLKRGQTEQFQITIEEDVGRVYKVRLGFTEDTPLNTKWNLDKMVLTCTESSEEYEFVLKDWVSVTKDHDLWVEIPVKAKDSKDQLDVKKYELLVYTGSCENAGTDAIAHVEISGERGDTGKRKLLQSKEGGRMFSQGKVDSFEIEAVDLQKPLKVLLGHNAQVKSKGWFVDKVLVRDGQEEFYFPCGRWLDTGEDDGAIERCLDAREPPSEEPAEKKYSWKVSTTTSKGKKKPHSENVVIVIYGEKGKTEELLLENTKKSFQPGKVDEFQVSTDQDVGQVYKIRVGFSGEKLHPVEWDLDQIQLLNLITYEEFAFVHKHLIRRDENSEGWTEIPVTSSRKEDILPVYDYELLVYTGACDGGGTEAQVYAEILGERGDTGRRRLLKSNENGKKFLQGKVDVFTISAVDLLNPTKVQLGHDGKGKGSGWFVDKVIVRNVSTKKEYFFPCERWLNEGMDDGETERLLEVKEMPKKEELPDQVWKVHVKTGQYPKSDAKAKGRKASKEQTEADADKSNHGVPAGPPSGQLMMAIYGHRERTDDLQLVPLKPPKFKEDNTDVFEVTFPGEIILGDIYKIRIGFSEETKEDQNWPLDSIQLLPDNTGKQYNFVLKDRLELNHMKDGWKEIPLTPESAPTKENDKKKDKKKDKKLEEAPKPLPVLKYEVAVHTSRLDNAGTQGQVYIELVGKRGDTGKRKLLQSKNCTVEEQFQSGQVSLFEIEAVDLLDLTSISIGHDSTEAGSGWHLHKVVVKPDANAEQRYVFLCHKWLDIAEDDGAIQRTIPLLEPGEKWEFQVTTGKEESSSCPGPLHLVLYGDEGFSKSITLGQEENFQFMEGKMQEFSTTVYPEDEWDEIGNLYKVRLGFMEEGGDRMWHFNQLVATRLDDMKEFTFKGGVWVRLGDDSDSWREFPVHQDDPTAILPVVQYQVETFTADQAGAGTDAGVYIRIFGERGDSGTRQLLKSMEEGNKFESGKHDLFEIEAVDLLDLTRITIGHDGKGFGSGWLLDKVVIRPGTEGDNKYIFNCGRWLDEGEDDGLIERTLELTQVIDAEEDPPEEGDWRILVMTSDKDMAGTDAQVTLTVFGINGDSGPLPLGEPDGGFFEKGATDQFDIWLEPEEVGKVRKIRIEHDNNHEGCGWHLNKVVFEDKFVGTVLEFPVDRWLDEDEDDGDIVRELPAHYPGEEPLPVTKYLVTAFTGDKRGAGTDAKVYVNLIGKNGDSGKRPLNISQEPGGKFESGKKDVFSLEAVDLGPLEKVIVGHNGSGIGSGWYLEKLIVKDTTTNEEMLFPCNNWLDEGEGDGKLERELLKAPSDDKPKGKGKKK